VLDALQSSWFAGVISELPLATASLSSLHLLGFTLVMGSALFCGLHLLGLLLPGQPTAAIVRPAAMNPIFRLKMLFLLGAVLLHAFVVKPLEARPAAGVLRRRMSGFAVLVLWVGVAVAGCAFILLE